MQARPQMMGNAANRSKEQIEIRDVTQLSLFPMRVRSLIPNTTGSVDLRYFAVGEDGHEYAVKESLPANPELPAAEYLGYCLSTMCQVAVPPTVLLEMPDGTHAFGSRFEGGVSGFGSLSPIERFAALRQCAAEVTALLTLDVFLSNDDRHLNNFLQRRTALQGNYSMVAIDFSRALWAGGFPVTPPATVAATGNTAQTINFLKSARLWDNGRSQATTAAIDAVQPADYGNWVSALPSGWQTPNVHASVTWWGTPDKSQRVIATAGCV